MLQEHIQCHHGEKGLASNSKYWYKNIEVIHTTNEKIYTFMICYITKLKSSICKKNDVEIIPIMSSVSYGKIFTILCIGTFMCEFMPALPLTLWGGIHESERWVEKACMGWTVGGEEGDYH